MRCRNWLVMLTFMSACERHPTGPTPPPDPTTAVARVEIEDLPSSLRVGSELRLRAHAVDRAGRRSNVAVAWSGGDSAIASISASGLITPVGPGTAAFVASADTAHASVQVRVTVRPFISAGGHTTCAGNEDGVLYCWGHNSEGEAGTGATVPELREPTKVATGVRFVQVSVGSSVTCASTALRDVYCWGWFSQDLWRTPRAVELGGERFRAISGGGPHACGIGDSGLTYCWGWTSNGILGVGPSASSTLAPTRVATDARFATVVGGPSMTCALTSEGVLYCWGYRAPGDGPEESCLDGQCRTRPTVVPGSLRYSSVGIGIEGLVCGLAGMDVYCWDTDPTRPPDRQVSGFSVREFESGAFFFCGRQADGTLLCFGDNRYGQLGRGTATGYDPATYWVPAPVGGGLRFLSFGLGFDHACGVSVDERFYCWGRNDQGQLGAGPSADSAVPRLVTLPQSP